MANSTQPYGTLFIIAAPSGAGKTSLVTSLVETTPNLMVSISYTTRPKREGEQNGVHYHFVDDITFLAMIEEKAFLEHANVYGKHYGTARQTVEDNLASGQDVILEIDWQGADNVRKLFPEAVSIYILPPSLDALKERLSRRGQDDEATIDRRFAEAKQDLGHCKDFDFIVINDVFEEALRELRGIFQVQRLKTSQQMTRHHRLIDQLLA